MHLTYPKIIMNISYYISTNDVQHYWKNLPVKPSTLGALKGYISKTVS